MMTNEPLIVDLLVAYAFLILVAGLSALPALLSLKAETPEVCRCPNCGRHELLTPYAEERKVKKRVMKLLCGGILPGLVYFSWVAKRYRCPHCFMVASVWAVMEKKVRRRRRQRQRRILTMEGDGRTSDESHGD